MGSGIRSPNVRLRKAIATGNVLLIDAAAAECQRLELDEALGICLVYLEHDAERYSRAAARWVARLVEREQLTVGEVLAISVALNGLLASAERATARKRLSTELQLLGLQRCSAVVGEREGRPRGHL